MPVKWTKPKKAAVASKPADKKPAAKGKGKKKAK